MVASTRWTLFDNNSDLSMLSALNSMQQLTYIPENTHVYCKYTMSKHEHTCSKFIVISIEVFPAHVTFPDILISLSGTMPSWLNSVKLFDN